MGYSRTITPPTTAQASARRGSASLVGGLAARSRLALLGRAEAGWCFQGGCARRAAEAIHVIIFVKNRRDAPSLA